MFTIRAHYQDTACPTVQALRETLAERFAGQSVAIHYDAAPHGLRRVRFVDVSSCGRVVESYGEARPLDFTALAAEASGIAPARIEQAAEHLGELLWTVELENTADYLAADFPSRFAPYLAAYAQRDPEPETAHRALCLAIQSAGGLRLATIDNMATLTTADHLQTMGYPLALAQRLPLEADDR